MLNSKPNGATKTYSGLFVPTNRRKVVRLNDEGGLYYRSLWERKTMVYLDINSAVLSWGAEFIGVPYTYVDDDGYGNVKVSQHTYFPDFYYEIQMTDGRVRKILLEVKPIEQVFSPKPKETNRLTEKQLINYKKQIDTYQKNLYKWEAAIKYCELHGYEFKVLVESEIDKMVSVMMKLG